MGLVDGLLPVKHRLHKLHDQWIIIALGLVRIIRITRVVLIAPRHREELLEVSTELLVQIFKVSALSLVLMRDEGAATSFGEGLLGLCSVPVFELIRV